MKTASYFFLISLLLPPTLVAQDTAEVPIAHAYNLEEQAHHDEVIALIRPLIESNTLHERELGRAWQVLALAYLNHGDYASAQPAFERAISILKTSPNPSDYPVALENLSDLYFLTGQPSAAIELRQRALSILEQLGDHAEIALTCNRLAAINLQFGNKKHGRKYLERTLQEMQLATDLHDDDRADIYIVKAGFASDDGHWPAAIQDMNEAIHLWQSMFGEAHPNVGWDRMLLGQIYAKSGNMPDAEREMQQGLADLEQTTGHSSPYYLQAALAYAELLDKRGDHAKAARFRSTPEPALKPSSRTACNGCTISVDALR